MPADCARHFDQIGFAVLLVAGAVCAGAFTTVASFHWVQVTAIVLLGRDRRTIDLIATSG
jgi:hypothetical protein